MPPSPYDDSPPVGFLAKLQQNGVQVLSNWKFWVIAALLLTSGSAAFALAVLLRLPGLPNCPAIFWPLASASLRFECARIAASKRTMNDLLQAIALVDSLPSEHPLREEADRLVELWSEDLLQLAEEAFNAGKLNEAVAAARRISTKASAYRLVEERIKRWQSIWSEAENIYNKAEDALRDLNWRKAFDFAVRLLNVENKYWQTTKYEELTNRITTAREDGAKLAKANRLADEGGLDKLLEAIKLAESIGPKSYVHDAAQEAIAKFGDKLVDLAEASLERRDLQGALKILGKLPESLNRKEEAKDLTALAYAQSQSWLDTVLGLEDAISQAQRIAPNRPLYKRAQQLIARWQREIEALAQLEKAKVLAQPGSLEDLKAAIAEASQVSESNPRWSEVQRQIGIWTKEIQTTEDRPILNQADQIASQGDIGALEAAIAQASQIAQGRALYPEARDRIDQWTAKIQRIQDQPILEQARGYASAGDYSTAITVAGQIKSGRSLYNDAQSDIEKWRNQIRAAEIQVESESALQEARRLASTGSSDDLAKAIQQASQVSKDSRLRSEAEAVMNDWSRQLLQVAESRSNFDLLGAIAIAQKIPAGTAAYDDAQRQIQTWQKTTAPQ